MAEPVPEASNGFVQYPIFNQMVPDEGAKAIRARCAWDTVNTYVVDLTDAINRGIMRSVQSLYIDNANNAAEVVITTNGSGQRIRFPALCQGYLPILLPNPATFEVSSSVAADQVTVIHMINVPMYPYIWLL